MAGFFARILGTKQDRLALSAGHGRIEKVRILLDKGAAPNSASGRGILPLVAAASGGHIEVVKALLDAGGDPNTQQPESQTALAAAASGGHMEAVRILLEAGADPNACAAGVKSPLEAAASGGHLEVVQALFDAGADVAMWGDRALANTVSYGPDNPQLVGALLRAGADPNARFTGEAGHPTVLSQAAGHGQSETVILLLEAGADPYAGLVGEDWKTVRQGTLLGRSGRIDSLPDFGKISMIRAACKGHTDVVRAMLAHGVDPNRRDHRTGATALWFAALLGHEEIVGLLLKAGADALVTGNLSFNMPPASQVPAGMRLPLTKGTALEVAEHAGYDEIAGLLRSAAASGASRPLS